MGPSQAEEFYPLFQLLVLGWAGELMWRTIKLLYTFSRSHSWLTQEESRWEKGHGRRQMIKECATNGVNADLIGRSANARWGRSAWERGAGAERGGWCVRAGSRRGPGMPNEHVWRCCHCKAFHPNLYSHLTRLSAGMGRRRGGAFASADIPQRGPDGGTALRLIPPTCELTSWGTRFGLIRCSTELLP